MNRQRQREREIELARARDQDAVERKKRTALYAVTLLLSLRPKLLQARRAKRKAIDKTIRRLKYHEPRAVMLTEEIRRPEKSDWAAFLRKNSDRDESWYEWVTLPKESFDDLVELCHPIWKANAIRSHKGELEHGKPRPQDIKRRKLDCVGTIAITLNFHAKPDSVDSVGKKFGLTEYHATKYIVFGMTIVIATIRNHPRARIHWRTDDENYVREQKEALQSAVTLRMLYLFQRLKAWNVLNRRSIIGYSVYLV